MGEVITEKKQRLQFIDMARSVAIILMLEGHFVDTTLDLLYRRPNNIKKFANPDFFAYDIWEYIRGFTAPMFLTITGVVFVYLLLGKEDVPFWQNVRVKKGFKRVVELMFWGFLLQPSAFHVLQCISVGILLILFTYGLSRLVKVIPIYIYFFLLGTLFFVLNIYIERLPVEVPWPENAPTVIQNMIRSTKNRALFPVVPWLGFTFYGAFIGALIFKFKDSILSYKSAALVFVIGLCLYSFPTEILVYFNKLFLLNSFEALHKIDWLYIRIGMILMILAVLIAINTFKGSIKDNLFLKMGQNTLTIFITHFMILYGSIIVIGINDFFKLNLNPYQSAFGALIFVLYFALFVKYLDWIKSKLSFILDPIKQFWIKVYKLG